MDMMSREENPFRSCRVRFWHFLAESACRPTSPNALFLRLRGTSLQIIGKSLGHKSMQSTEIYARLTTDPVREAVEKATEKMAEHWTEKDTGSDSKEAGEEIEDQPDSAGAG